MLDVSFSVSRKDMVIWGKVPDRNKEMHDACYMKTFFAEVFVISMLVWIKNGARVWPEIKTRGKPLVRLLSKLRFFGV